MGAAFRDWRDWVWPLIAGGLVLAIAIAGVLTVPDKTATAARKHPPDYVKQAALAAARENGDAVPRAVEWIVTTHDVVGAAFGVHDERPGYKRDALILVQGDFTSSPGTPPEPPGQQRSSWLALLYTGGKIHRELALVGAYAQRPSTKGLPTLKRFEW
jgi:hypothetical protein